MSQALCCPPAAELCGASQTNLFRAGIFLEAFFVPGKKQTQFVLPLLQAMYNFTITALDVIPTLDQQLGYLQEIRRQPFICNLLVCSQ